MASDKNMKCNQNCNKCKKSITDLIVKCSGLCGSFFHTACANLGKREYNALTLNEKNLKWFCDDCEGVLCDTDGSVLSSTISWDTKDAPLLNKILNKINILFNAMVDMKSELTSLKDVQKRELTTCEKSTSTEPCTNKLPTKINKVRSKSVNEIPLTSHQTSENNEDKLHQQVKCLKILPSDVTEVPTYASAAALPVKKRPNVPIIGTARANDEKKHLSAVQRKAWLHVWRASPETTTEDIHGYLKNKKIQNEVIVEKLISKGNYASFKVGVNFENLNQLMDPDFWPTGIAINRFFHYRPGKFGKK